MSIVSCPKASRCARRFAVAVAISLGSALTPAGAVSLCVSSAQEFQQALTAATSTYSGSDVEIDLVQGIYQTGTATANGAFSYNSNALTGSITLVGGWNAQCASQQHRAALTVLDGNHNTQVLAIRSPDAPVTLLYLTIENGESNAAGGGLAINPSGGSSDVFIENNIIKNNHTSNAYGGLFVLAGASGHELDLLANVISGNSSENFGAGAVGANVAAVTVISNTIFDNTATQAGGTGGLDCCVTPAFSPTIYFNIFSQNSGFGMYLNGTPADLEYNDFGSRGGIAPAVDVGNTNVSPAFVDPSNDDLRLSSTSALLAYAEYIALGTQPDTDVNGNKYPQSGRIDLGAHEDTVFTDNGFEAD